MPVSEAQKRARNKYDSENMARVTVKVNKTLLQEFKQTVAARGDRVNTVLREAIIEYINRE